jgi:hypothetical protein
MTRLAPLLLVAMLFPALNAQAPVPDRDRDELAHYTLTMDKVTHVMQSFADLAALAKTNPQMAAAVQSSADKNQSLADIDRRVAAYPQLVAVFAQHGLTSHEFLVVELTLFQSMMALAGKQAGADPAKLAADAHINPDNITFVEQHRAELEELQKKYPMPDGD